MRQGKEGAEMRTRLQGLVLTTGLLAFKPGTAGVGEGTSFWFGEEGWTIAVWLVSFLPPYSIMHPNTFTPV